MDFMVCPPTLRVRPLSDTYGEECQQKYGSASVWKACCSVFDYLNLAAVRVILPSRPPILPIRYTLR